MKSKILIVDDDSTHCRMLEAVLTAENYITFQAQDGQAAIDAVKAGFYDLILMDIRMTRVGGMEALEKIKTLNPEIPIIMMTAYSSVPTTVKAMKSGAYNYLTKPLDIDDLKILVAKALRHHDIPSE